MNQTLHITNEMDEEGNVYGGAATSEGIQIQWQNPESSELEGALVEGVITAALSRLQFLQSSPKFHSRERSLAITKLEEALHWLSHKPTT